MQTLLHITAVLTILVALWSYYFVIFKPDNDGEKTKVDNEPAPFDEGDCYL